MADFETYEATADAKRAKEVAATASPYKIKVRFLGGLNARQKSAFKKAADRWTRVIVGDLPRVRVDGELIDDILILAQGAAIDGPGRILGQAGPLTSAPVRPAPTRFSPPRASCPSTPPTCEDGQRRHAQRCVATRWVTCWHRHDLEDKACSSAPGTANRPSGAT